MPNNSSTTCGAACSSCSVVGNTSTCSICMSGWVLNGGSCNPCQAGCAVCSNNNFNLCLQCLSGYYVNSTKGCSFCTPSCASCNSLGCIACHQGYQLTTSFTCSLPCASPCATCSTKDPTSCLSCVYGFTLQITSTISCVPNTQCNSKSNCKYCPFGFALSTNGTNTTIQTCVSCNPNCVRCLANNPDTCLACGTSQYLTSTNTCDSCATGCQACLSLSLCFTCSQGYLLNQAASLAPSSMQPATCIKCIFPCATCTDSPETCLTCQPSFTYQGSQCVSNFNFQAVTVLDTTPVIFNQKYISFLSIVSNYMGVSIYAVTVLSINYGSVTVTFQVSTTASPASSEAVAQQNALTNALSSNNIIANMRISSSSITTNGGSNDIDNNDGLSQATIIILATVIPIATLCNNLLI